MWRGGKARAEGSVAVASTTSCRGTGNISSPNDVSTGLCMDQAAWLLTRIAYSGVTWLLVHWEGSFPISVPEPAVPSHAQALELRRLPAK